MKIRKLVATLLCTVMLFGYIGMAQAANTLPEPPKDTGIITLLKAVRPLGTIASVVNTAVHPDDEQSTSLAALSLGQGVDILILNITRGQGGQNAIGPEYHNAMGVLRTMEMEQNLKVLHVDNVWGRYDFDSPCIDFGFSKLWEEAEELWDFDYIADFIALNIRRQRPQVGIHHAQNIRSEHGQHQAMYITFQMGVERAADPARDYEGLPAYQIPKVYERCPEADSTVTIDVGAYDPWYGKTYVQLGQYARSFHACQGMGGNPYPAPSTAYFMMTNEGAHGIKNAGKEESIFAGLPFDFDEYAALIEDETVAAALKQVQESYREIEDIFPHNEKVYEGLVKMKAKVEEAIGAVEDSALSDEAKYDAMHLLNTKQIQLSEAMAAATGLSVRIEMTDYEIIPNQETELSVRIHQGTGAPLNVKEVALSLPQGWQISKGEQEGELGDNGTYIQKFTIKADETAEKYNAFHGNALTATAVFEEGFSVTGIAEQTFALLPEFSVKFDVETVALNTAKEITPKEHTIVVSNLSNEEKTADIALEVPEGWTVEPVSVQETFTPGEAKNIAFTVTAPAEVAADTYSIKAVIKGEAENRTTVQPIDYSHISKAFYLYDAQCTVQAFPLVYDENLKVGYISSGSDTVGSTLATLGMKVTFLEEEDVRFGDLSQYDTIVTGIRAYKNVKWLEDVNQRLLDYAKAGGNVVVQYHTSRDGYTPELAPYPLTVGNPSLEWRITREDSPVTALLPEHPILNSPNKLDETAWENWVQERSLYIPMEWDEAYETPIRSGLVEQEGAEYDGQILTAAYGEGRFTYTAIVFFRQVPALVPGGVQLFTNIISQ